MIEAFYAVFLVAFFLTIYTLTIVEQDLEDKSYRPAVLLFSALIAWFTTIGLLITPTTNTLVIPSYVVTTSTTTSNVPLFCSGANVLTTCGTTTETTNTIQTYPALTQTTSVNSPLPTYAFYEYTVFAGAMALLCLMGFILFLIKMSVTEVIDAAKGFLK